MKFNTSNTSIQKTVNHEGATAYVVGPALRLYTAVVTTTLSDNFYEKDKERLTRIQQLVRENKPEFVAKLAVYAREQMYLRLIPTVLTVELARVHSGDDLVSRTVARVVQRPDEITEMLAYYAWVNKREGNKKLSKISKQIQKGLAQAFNRFDAYQLAKYNRKTSVTLKDALFLVHPKAKSDEQQGIFNQLVSDTLPTPYTWEVELSALGQQSFANDIQKQVAVRAKWEELIDSNRLGYMALLRNLRNILEAHVSYRHVMKIVENLADEQAVARSKQLPFRYLSAYNKLQSVTSTDTSIILQALEIAVTKSIANLPGFDLETKVLIACDVSGSMQKSTSPKSAVQYYDIGLLLGMLLQHRCQRVITGMFGDFWKIVNLPHGQILGNTDALRRHEGEVGYSTNGYLVVQDLINRREIVDKVMIFTDCQLWDSGNRIPYYNRTNNFSTYWHQYKKIAPNAKLYLFDLSGYGTAPVDVRNNDVHLIAGWSDKVFSMLDAIEKSGNSITEIEKIVL